MSERVRVGAFSVSVEQGRGGRGRERRRDYVKEMGGRERNMVHRTRRRRKERRCDENGRQGEGQGTQDEEKEGETR